MVLGSVALFARHGTLGGVPLACFAVANVVGVALWRARSRLAPYPAIQVLLAVLGVCAVVALFSLTEGLAGAARYYRGLLLFPMLMIYFHFLERAALRKRTSAE